MNQFVKRLDEDGACFAYLRNAFPGLSSEELQAGIFNGSRICKLIKDRNFSLNMTKVVQNAGNLYVSFVKRFRCERFSWKQKSSKLDESCRNYACELSGSLGHE